MTRVSTQRLLPLLILCSVAGWSCAHFPLNVGLDETPSFDPVLEDFESETLVILALSGGGTRAAAFSFGVLEALRETPWKNGRSLLEEVDVISSVSGGSLVSVALAQGSERFFEEFPRTVLYRNIQGDLQRQLMFPRNWFRLASADFERIDLVAEYFGQHIFENQSFADLPSRPEVIVNATDIGRGTRFDFTPDRFAALCSDLGAYPLGRAVAASAAVPVLLSPITLENFGWQQCHYGPPEPAAPPEGLSLVEKSPRTARRLAAWKSYEDATTLRYLHLFDGGLVDNLGLEVLLDDVFALSSVCEASQRRGLSRIREVLIISVNAVTNLDRSADLDKSGPSLLNTVWAAANIPIDRHSFQTIDLLRNQVEVWSGLLGDCGNGQATPKSSDVIVVDFEAVRSQELRERFLSLPTTLALPSEDVDALRREGRRIVLEKLNELESQR